MSSEQLFEEISKRLGKQPEEVRATLRDSVEILDCIAEMRENRWIRFVMKYRKDEILDCIAEMRKNQDLDGISSLITLGIRGTARVLERLTQ